jgi:hypothetical protein
MIAVIFLPGRIFTYLQVLLFSMLFVLIQVVMVFRGVIIVSMEPFLNVLLFGSLLKKEPGPETPLKKRLSRPMPLLEVLGLLGIQTEEVTLAMVNHKSVPTDWSVQPGDRLSLFPREYPIFANWLDHRLNI